MGMLSLDRCSLDSCMSLPGPSLVRPGGPVQCGPSSSVRCCPCPCPGSCPCPCAVLCVMLFVRVHAHLFFSFVSFFFFFFFLFLSSFISFIHFFHSFRSFDFIPSFITPILSDSPPAIQHNTTSSFLSTSHLPETLTLSLSCLIF